jgi:DNA-directed RNA polymerase subunit alpha
MATPVAEIKISVRIINTLEDADIILVADLIRLEKHQLTKIKNFGEKTVSELINALNELGVKPPLGWQPEPVVAKKRAKKK